MLGSLLLPSYTIRPCLVGDRDRVYRKYAFKAEHRNTRSFYLAAESRQSMIQWMNALSLAAILQDPESASASPSTTSSSTSPAAAAANASATINSNNRNNRYVTSSIQHFHLFNLTQFCAGPLTIWLRPGTATNNNNCSNTLRRRQVRSNPPPTPTPLCCVVCVCVFLPFVSLFKKRRRRRRRRRNLVLARAWCDATTSAPGIAQVEKVVVRKKKN